MVRDLSLPTASDEELVVLRTALELDYKRQLSAVNGWDMENGGTGRPSSIDMAFPPLALEVWPS